MEYDKAQDVIITVLEVATSILKGVKKLRSFITGGLFKYNQQQDSNQCLYTGKFILTEKL